ncbi:hypothetical protein PYCC9005_004194 [Savitreella phatthalungensis]
MILVEVLELVVQKDEASHIFESLRFYIAFEIVFADQGGNPIRFELRIACLNT